MKTDAIQTIRQTEQQAEQIEAAAAEQAKKILADARAQAKINADAKLEAAQKEAVALVGKAKEVSAEGLKETMAQAQKEIQALTQNASAKKEQAIGQIIARLI